MSDSMRIVCRHRPNLPLSVDMNAVVSVIRGSINRYDPSHEIVAATDFELINDAQPGGIDAKLIITVAPTPARVGHKQAIRRSIREGLQTLSEDTLFWSLMLNFDPALTVGLP